MNGKFFKKCFVLNLKKQKNNCFYLEDLPCKAQLKKQ